MSGPSHSGRSNNEVSLTVEEAESSAATRSVPSPPKDTNSTHSGGSIDDPVSSVGKSLPVRSFPEKSSPKHPAPTATTSSNHSSSTAIETPPPEEVTSPGKSPPKRRPQQQVKTTHDGTARETPVVTGASPAQSSPKRSRKHSPKRSKKKSKSPKRSPRRSPKRTPPKATTGSSDHGGNHAVGPPRLIADSSPTKSPPPKRHSPKGPLPSNEAKLSPTKSPKQQREYPKTGGSNHSGTSSSVGETSLEGQNSPTKFPKRRPQQYTGSSSHSASSSAGEASGDSNHTSSSRPARIAPQLVKAAEAQQAALATTPPPASPRRQQEEKVHLTTQEKQQILRQAHEYIRANVKLISACQDEEITIDCSNVLVRFGLRQSKLASMAIGNDGGACTSVLLKILYAYASNPDDNGCPSYARLLEQMRSQLQQRGYRQVPALTSSRYLTLRDEFRVIPKHFNGTRRALIIGINYTGEKFEIPGCHNDCWNMIKYLKDVHGFVDDDIMVLMDDGVQTNPTRENITKALHRFAWSVKPGDAVFMHYAGHGSTQVDYSGDEEGGQDSTMLPVDYRTKGVIVDDEIFRVLLIPMPAGVHMTAIMDCCHSGSIFDLPFEYIGSSKSEGQTQEEALANVRFPHMDLVRAEKRRMDVMRALQKRASQIEVEFLKPPSTKKPESNMSAGATSTSRQPKSNRHKKPNGNKRRQPIKKADSSGSLEPQKPKSEIGKQAEEAQNCLLGACLLCLNPVKLLKAMTG